MSLDLANADAQPLTSVEELVAWFRRAERPRAEHRIGLEHEKFIYPRGGSRAIPYEGPQGIGALFSKLIEMGYAPYRESPDAPPIALMLQQLVVSLEPGGQLELSGSPFRTAREAHAENLMHLGHVREAAKALGLYPVALGYRPFDEIEQMPWMPKQRYGAMRQVLPTRGSMAKDMMLMTSTGQVSLDWEDEADCVRKVVVSARVTPLLVALYANSPIVRGQRTPWRSYRSHVWTDVDPARTGFLPSMFDNSFSYQAYVEWALEAPLLFLRRDGQYLRPNLTFGQLLEDGFDGKPATTADWLDHLSTLFPEVRIKKVVEIRGADAVNAELTGALAALWRGLLYDEGALSDAARILPPLSYTQHLEFMEVARREGLGGTWEGISIERAAQELIDVARRGLQRLDPDDASLLDPLEEVARSGRSPADEVIDAFEQEKDPARFLARFSL